MIVERISQEHRFDQRQRHDVRMRCGLGGLMWDAVVVGDARVDGVVDVEDRDAGTADILFVQEEPWLRYDEDIRRIAL
jgi:hypothetical protein